MINSNHNFEEEKRRRAHKNILQSVRHSIHITFQGISCDIWPGYGREKGKYIPVTFIASLMLHRIICYKTSTFPNQSSYSSVLWKALDEYLMFLLLFFFLPSLYGYNKACVKWIRNLISCGCKCDELGANWISRWQMLICTVDVKTAAHQIVWT